MSTKVKFTVNLGDLLRPNGEEYVQVGGPEWLAAVAERIKGSEWAKWRRREFYQDDLRYLLTEIYQVKSPDDFEVAWDQIADLAYEDGCQLDTYTHHQ